MAAAAPALCAVTLVGPAARRALGEGMRGRVSAAFRKSFYIETEEETRLACLGGPGLGAGPLNALCAPPEGLGWEAAGPRPGEGARVEGGRLFVGARLAFSLEGAAEWRPPAAPGNPRAEDLAAGLAALAGEAARGAEGLGRLIRPLAEGNPAGVREAAAGDPFLEAAARAAASLLRWLGRALRGGDGGPPPDEAAALVGLGTGLTPAGDDFLGGAMIGLRALGRTGPAERLAAWALPLARERTSVLSAAHLACAAEGLGAEALHRALAALLTPGAPGLASCLRMVSALGHTSGWDALAGAAAALAAALPRGGAG